jgi:integrase
MNRLKTEYSQDEVPLEGGFILILMKWQELCAATEQGWVFPSPATGRPYHADSIRAYYLIPAGVKLGLGRIGFHTFRRTYRAWLDETDGARFSHPALQDRNCESQVAGETRVQNSSKSRVSKNAIALMTLPSFIWKYHV